MRIFMSHHSSAKPLVREVRKELPAHVDAWIDEHEIRAGESLTDSIREAIEGSTDFLVLFHDERAAQSAWVKQELEWAIAEERRLRRPFVIPIILDGAADAAEPWLQDRLQLRCSGYSETQIRALAADLSSTLFAWLSRDLDALRSTPATTTERLLFADRADSLLEEAARAIRRIVFPYRRDRPLSLESLVGRLRDETNLALSSVDELHELLFRLRDRRMISGIALTGTTIFVGEEHLNWRSNEALQAKRVAAEYIVNEIPDRASVYLDGGSSALAVCRSICRGLRVGQWHHLSITTCAVPIAAAFSDLANELGLDDEDPLLSVGVLGGTMRLNTSVLVGDDSVTLGERRAFDVAVVGTNGVSLEYGCTTTAPSEAAGKRAALMAAERRMVMAEPSKYGVWQSESFAGIDEGLEIVTACERREPMVDEVVRGLAEDSPSRITVLDFAPDAGGEGLHPAETDSGP